MTEPNSEQLAWLNRYGFDQDLLNRWQAAVAAGELSKQANLISGELVPPGEGDILNLPADDSDDQRRLLDLGEGAFRRGEVGIVILNGGMATRFGGVVKGIVDVFPKDPQGRNRSFLALRMADVRDLQERFGAPIPVFLMNSFATDEATRQHFADNQDFGLDPTNIHHFTQFVSVRMNPDGSLFQLPEGADPGPVAPLSAYGPGHGDFAPALRASGCLGKFLAGGGKHLFVCNVDNLGARLDPLMLGLHLREGVSSLVEVAPKWPGDAGGAPFKVDGKLQLVEQLRYPADFNPDVVDVFNCNTFTFNAADLDRDFDLNWFYVEKKVEGAPAVQVERLIGELTRFLDSRYVRVSRLGSSNRFYPVKTPDDLEEAREELAELFGIKL